MPPKAKFSKEEIVSVALRIIRESGTNALTARELGNRLGSSARPIFTLFQSMEEVQSEAKKAAKAIYREYVKKGLSEVPAFKGVGTQYIRFAAEEPKLFQLLFMTENEELPKLFEVLTTLDENHKEILDSVEKSYGLSRENAWKLYRHLWIYTHGIATLCATKVCRFTETEISEMLTEVCISILHQMKAGVQND